MKINICKKYLKELMQLYFIVPSDDENDLIKIIKKNYDKILWANLPNNNNLKKLLQVLNITCEVICPVCGNPIIFYHPAEEFVDKTIIKNKLGYGYFIPSINKNVNCFTCSMNYFSATTTTNLNNPSVYANYTNTTTLYATNIYYNTFDGFINSSADSYLTVRYNG
jgi:hypothetical protein